mmetsp:Transcript_16557/g.45874  ORF Transcript_16557/g.45874 Transcript_16557/m.45874 type:complete len:217 (+) Transcript_16557:116-766(+)
MLWLDHYQDQHHDHRNEHEHGTAKGGGCTARMLSSLSCGVVHAAPGRMSTQSEEGGRSTQTESVRGRGENQEKLERLCSGGAPIPTNSSIAHIQERQCCLAGMAPHIHASGSARRKAKDGSNKVQPSNFSRVALVLLVCRSFYHRRFPAAMGVHLLVSPSFFALVASVRSWPWYDTSIPGHSFLLFALGSSRHVWAHLLAAGGRYDYYMVRVQGIL